jgi:hypothetical protein
MAWLQAFAARDVVAAFRAVGSNPHVVAELRLVYGGAEEQTRHGVRVLPGQRSRRWSGEGGHV